MNDLLHIVLVRPGATDLDDQERIKGSLDLPLNKNGVIQVAKTVAELAGVELDAIYAGPAQCAQQTAAALAEGRHVKIKTLDKLKNLDYGLWHGKRVAEVRQTQPKIYRQWQEHPESISPPEGESMISASHRARTILGKILKKHTRGRIAVVVSEPFASVIRSLISDSDLGDLWKREHDCGAWELIQVELQSV